MLSCNTWPCSTSTGEAGNILIADNAQLGSAGLNSGTSLTLSAWHDVQLGANARIEAHGGGNIAFRPDNTARGSGTLRLARSARVIADPDTVSIYYNPTNYSTPTDFAGLTALDYVTPLFQTSGIDARMYVNFSTSKNTRVYDGSTAITGYVVNLRSTGLPTGLDWNIGGANASLLNASAGSNKRYIIDGVNLTGSAQLLKDYVVNGLDTGRVDITPAALTLQGVSADRSYDRTTNATLSGTASVSAFWRDQVLVAGTPSASFADKNVGSNKAVSVSGFTLMGADAANYTLNQNSLRATISQAPLAVSGLSVADKVYDGSTLATLTPGLPSLNLANIGTDDVMLGGSASVAFADKNVGVNKAVTLSGLSLLGDDAGNYTLLPSLSASITPATLVASGLTANGKTYDATTYATLSGTAQLTPTTPVTQFSHESVSISGTGIGVFADKNVGSSKLVTVSGYQLTGADAANYMLLQPSGLTADITQATLQVAGLSALNKVYDATTDAQVSGVASVAALGSDDVRVSGSASAAFADKNVGNVKQVTVSGYQLTGLDAANYTLLQPSGLSADISKATLQVAGVTASNKTYDATINASLDGTAIVAALGSDDVSVSGTALGSFADKNVGSGKAVTVSGYTLAGADAGNYALLQPTGLSADISKATVQVTGVTASNKTYDATVNASLGGTAIVDALGSDDVSVSGTALASFTDKHAGSGKAVTVRGYTLTGADAGNYALAQPTGLSADIGKATLQVAGVAAVNKIYDASVNASLAGNASVAALGSDDVSVSGTANATFADKNAGSGKAVSVSGYTLTGSDAGNYALVQPTGLSADISKATLQVAGVTAANKIYDATVNASLAGTATVAALGSDDVSLSGTVNAAFADKNVGSAKQVTVSGYQLGGADAANYVVIQPGGLTADITPAQLYVSGIRAHNKLFDGTSVANVDSSGAILSGLFKGDQLTLTARGSFADPAPGSDKFVLLESSYAGADLGNYQISDQRTVLASIEALAPTPLPIEPLPPTPAPAPAPVLPQLTHILSNLLSQQSNANAAAAAADGEVLLSQGAPDTQQDPGLMHRIGSGARAPQLVTQSGGLRLPALASNPE